MEIAEIADSHFLLNNRKFPFLSKFTGGYLATIFEDDLHGKEPHKVRPLRSFFIGVKKRNRTKWPKINGKLGL